MGKKKRKHLQDIEAMYIDDMGKVVIRPKETEAEKEAKRILSCIRFLTKRGVIIKTSHR